MRTCEAGASAEGVGVSEWQPIETAPEGVMLLFCSMSATIESRDWCFVDWLVNGRTCSGVRRFGTPTHWMPLPEPPA